jgi:hypothetical protein
MEGGAAAPIIFTGYGGFPELMRITGDGKVGIGTATPTGALHVAAKPSVVDQSQLIYVGFITASNQWQSFTAGITGMLTGFTVRFDTSGGPYTVRVLSGAGLDGTVLSTTTVTGGGTSYTFNINPCHITSGSVYTLNFVEQTAWYYDDGTGSKVFSSWVAADATAPTDLLIVATTGTTLGTKTISNGLTTLQINQELAKGASITIDANTTGWGTLMGGDNVHYALFSWTSAGVVNLRDSTGVVATDTVGSLCIFDGGDHIHIKNNTGIDESSLTIQATLNYSVVGT